MMTSQPAALVARAKQQVNVRELRREQHAPLGFGVEISFK